MAVPLIAEAAVGAVFGELLKAILEIKDKAVMFKPTLVYPQSTLIAIAPVIKEIEHHNELQHPKEELKSLLRQMEEGKKLVYECSKIHWLDLVARVRYQNKLEALVDSLVRFFIVDMQDQTARDQKETLLKVNKILSTVDKLSFDTVAAYSDSSGLGELIRIISMLLAWITAFIVKLTRITSTLLLTRIFAFIVTLMRIAFTSSTKWKPFAPDKQNGKLNKKKCYMLSARSLSIIWGDTPSYWKWTSVTAARVSKVAELVSVCRLQIKGRIKTRMLPPNTLYGAYLVFKQSSDGAYRFENQPVEVSVRVAGKGDGQRRIVYLVGATQRKLGVEYPKERSDGWMEVELGDFFNGGVEDKEMEMGVYETKDLYWKRGHYRSRNRNKV